MQDALLSLVSPVVLAAFIAMVGAYKTATVAFAGVTLQRRLETAKLFAELAEVGNNHDGKRGTYEMIAAQEMLASFGRDEPHLRHAARSVLQAAKDRMVEKGTPHLLDAVQVGDAAKAALDRIPDVDDDNRPRLLRRR